LVDFLLSEIILHIRVRISLRRAAFRADVDLLLDPESESELELGIGITFPWYDGITLFKVGVRLPKAFMV
jgi:hypothetical protein